MRKQKLELSINSNGTIRLIYDDRIKSLLNIGRATIARASSVEPEGTDWMVDLSPVGGPIVRGFHLRQKALAFEMQWLTKNYL